MVTMPVLLRKKIICSCPKITISDENDLGHMFDRFDVQTPLFDE
jgi:hypothetical protein